MLSCNLSYTNDSSQYNNNNVYFLLLQISILEKAAPFQRKIHPDEIWLYRNPRTQSYVPTEVLWPFVFGIPCTVFLIYLLVSKNKLEFIQANMGLTLALGLNGIITNVLKLCVGKHCVWSTVLLTIDCCMFRINVIHRTTAAGFLLEMFSKWWNEQWNGMYGWWEYCTWWPKIVSIGSFFM